MIENLVNKERLTTALQGVKKYIDRSSLPQDGEVGQVLTKTEDGTEWKDAQSAGGSSDLSNYATKNDLNNVFSDLSADSNDISITIGNKTKTLTVPYAENAGTADTASKASQLATARAIFGVSFNGSAAITKRVYTSTTSGAITLNASSYDIGRYTLSGNVSGMTLSGTATKGNDYTFILYGNGTARTVAVAHSGNYRTSTGSALTISVPANGYAEVNILYDGTYYWVRAV